MPSLCRRQRRWLEHLVLSWQLGPPPPPAGHRQLTLPEPHQRASSPSLSPTSFDGFFSSAGSLSRSTSSSSTDIEAADFAESWLEFASPIPAPAILRDAISSPPSPTIEVDEAAEEARKRNEKWHRDLKRMKQNSRLWRKIGRRLQKRGMAV